MEQLYQDRLKRYVTAMRNGKPDRVPIRPFVAEFTAKYAGMDCQDITHDYRKAFAAARKCAADFDWDAVVGNMVYVWTGLTETLGTRYYAAPGIHQDPDIAFQYREPSEQEAFMKPEEYDDLIADPTGYLFNVWLPRVSKNIVAPGQPATFDSNMAFLRGGMSMLDYFFAFGTQNDLLRRESGTVAAISGILKAPFDILADKLRGYIGLCTDLSERPEKVLAACEALMPHITRMALSGADPAKNVPIGLWAHRGCVPFISHRHFRELYWPTLKPILLELWKHGHQTLFYAEGKWGAHFEAFNELPDASIVFHVDRDDIFAAHKAIGHKFCLSGGLSNYMLAFAKPEEVREQVRKIIQGVAQDGGYIMDASAIVQHDATVENMHAMTEAAREYGAY